MQTINVVTLGCHKNIVDSEYLMRQLEVADFKVIYDSSEKSDIIILNTCSFINDAKEESLDSIFNFVHAKQEGLIKKIFVMGCLSQRYRQQLMDDIPEVDGFYGVGEIEKIVSDLGKSYNVQLGNERLLSTPSHYAFLKISDGCDRHCSFCAIPAIKGTYKSQSIENLVSEANFLAQKGVKEIILVAQDISFYGYDLYKSFKLAELITELSKVSGIEWIRLQYAYPNNFPQNVIDLIASNPKVCHYLDVPVQHISNRMLKIMNRAITKERTIELLKQIRSKVPDISLRTTILVGHPGETEEDFIELLAFINEIKFDRLGVFTYSHEDNTPSFNTMEDDVPDEIKMERADELMAEQQAISHEKNQLKIGKSFRVLIDREEGAYLIGRTQYDSPEIDNEVLIEKLKGNVSIGTFVNVKITGAEEFDLYAKII